jgi:hypothetical protein
VDQPRHPTSQQTRLGFAAKTTLPCALSLSWIPTDFRLWVVELGPRSHPHSEEWMCFFGPDASFRDLQRPTASHGHVPACPILARCEVLPQCSTFGWCGCSFEHPGKSALRPIRADPSGPPQRDALFFAARRPGSRPSPLRPEDRSPPSLSHDDDMAVARAGQPREKVERN